MQIQALLDMYCRLQQKNLSTFEAWQRPQRPQWDIPAWEGDDPRCEDTRQEADMSLLNIKSVNEAGRAFRKASLWAQPDKGGKAKDFRELCDAKKRLEEAASLEANWTQRSAACRMGSSTSR